MKTKKKIKGGNTKVTTIAGKNSNMFLVKTEDVRKSKRACLPPPLCPSIINSNFPKKHSKKKKSKENEFQTYYLSGNTGRNPGIDRKSVV